jgi:hypothetical protein
VENITLPHSPSFVYRQLYAKLLSSEYHLPTLIASAKDTFVAMIFSDEL